MDNGALLDWLVTKVPGFAGPLQIRAFGIGQSNPTYRLTTPSAEYVLRRRPPGHLLPSAHAVDREFRVISALERAGFPVAHPFAFCEDSAVIGSIFYVMSLVEGRVLSVGALPDHSPAERRATYLALIDALGALHRIEPERAGLGD